MTESKQDKEIRYGPDGCVAEKQRCADGSARWKLTSGRTKKNDKGEISEPETPEAEDDREVTHIIM